MTTETMTTTTTTTALTSSATIRPITFMDTLASEWVKLTSVRSTYVTLGIGAVLSVAMTALVSLAVGSTFDGWSPERQAQFAPILMTVTGNVVLLIATAVFGVLAVGSEYSNGMIRLTLTATPRRGRVLVAKLVLVSSITLVVGVVTVVAMHLAGQAVLGSYGVSVPGMDNADTRRLILGLGMATPLFPVIGVVLGVLMRSTAGAITASLGLMWLPQAFSEVLPAGAQDVLKVVPQAGADSLAVAHLAESPMYSDPAAGAAIVTAWLVVLIGAAYVTLARRDA